MSQFLADIAGMLELFAIAAGLLMLHRAAKEPPAQLLRAAALVLLIGGVAVGLCTGYYWFEYRSRGEFRSAYMMTPEAMMQPGAMQPDRTSTDSSGARKSPPRSQS